MDKYNRHNRNQFDNQSSRRTDDDNYKLAKILEADKRREENYNKRREERENKRKDKERKRSAVFLGTIAAGAILGAYSLDKLTDDNDPNRYDEDITPIEEISLQDGAIIRESPTIPSLKSDDPVNKLIEIDLGDQAENGTLTFRPEANAYEIKDFNSGTWYGFTAEDLAKNMPAKKAKKLGKDEDGIVWVNAQKASVEYTDEQAK